VALEGLAEVLLLLMSSARRWIAEGLAAIIALVWLVARARRRLTIVNSSTKYPKNDVFTAYSDASSTQNVGRTASHTQRKRGF
jgi:hypothetical protein